MDFWFRFLGRKYAGVIKRYSPDLIVITQGLACQWLGRLKTKGLIDVPLAAVITDFIVHPFWVSNKIDLYIVANEEMRDELVCRGISKDKIVVTGIPIDPRFNIVYDKTFLMNKLELTKDRIKVLVMGGGWGLGRMDRILTIIDKMSLPLELLVITGRNRRLYRRLRNRNFALPV
ncbi:MAG: UDP-N-acetylglucosamine--LPS N-acetylglucosamine transferase, partial [candidate division KSB1 bacterium]|nr:UDP-N-acetylglucosamine--LPS N-acetylglucosamine transferase [candidate division KSB1 bacterium]